MKILVTGPCGQVGADLYPALWEKYGEENVVCLGHRKKPSEGDLKRGTWEFCDATDKDAVKAIMVKHKITHVYHLVGILSATGEKDPELAWNVNIGALKVMLDLAVELKVERMFWPSSIAAFGPTTPRKDTPQKTIMEPTTMYGVCKVAGELLCQYHHQKFGLDVRSLRYPGLISWKAEPGGGTTDYSVAVFYGALKEGHYDFFVRADTVLPMMYMDDAVKGTIDIMEADPAKITVRTSYNHSALSFSAKELAEEIKKHLPDFTYSFKPDFRQKIADSWPQAIDDSKAREDWGWKPTFSTSAMVEDMIKNVSKKLGK